MIIPKCLRLFDLASARCHGLTRTFKRLIDGPRKSLSHAIYPAWMRRIIQKSHALRSKTKKFRNDSIHSRNILMIKIK